MKQGMAGKAKKGLDYAGWSVHIFDGDTKIDKLIEAQGWIGFSIYFYLCQMAYKFDGYFYRWSYDDSATTARRMGGGVRSETVKQTVRLCLQIGLFDKRLFDRDGILTSRGIQRRFCDVVLRSRRRRIVQSNYWLLSEEESCGLEVCADENDLLPTNGYLQATNGDSQPANAPKRKVKESKVNSPPTPPDGGRGLGEELDAVLSEWLTYKNEMRQPCGATALKNLVDTVRQQAAAHGDKAVADLIRLCMANGWRGIVWEKLEKTAGTAGGKPAFGSPDKVKAELVRMEKYLQQLRRENGKGE